MATYLPNVTDVFPQPVTYTPDFSYMDKMLRRKQNMYEQGFAQVASKYNFLNRPVSIAANREFRDNFMRQAVENLKGLSAMDLSVSQNVQAANNVFQPFYTNENVLGDMAVTAHFDQQESIGESYRLKDGGKEFSEDNVAYVRQQREAFANSDPSSWRQFYGNKRYYTPYHDYNKSVQEAMKNFKPSVYQNVNLQGLYKITEKDESWREAEIRRYLDAVLSDKDKQQMRIEASVRLGSNPEALRMVYGEIGEREKKINNLNLEQLKKELALENDPDKKSALTDLRTQLEESNAEIDRTMENLRKGDPGYMNSNADRLAFQIYYNQSVNKWAKGFKYDNIIRDIDPNAAAIAVMREDREDARLETRMKFDYQLKMFELQGMPGDYNIAEPSLGEDSEIIANVTARSQKQITELSNQMNGLQTQSLQHILNSINEGKPESERLTINQIGEEEIKKWLETGGPGGNPIPKTDQFYKNQNAIKEISERKRVLENQLKTIDDAGYRGLTEDEQKEVKGIMKNLEKIPGIRLEDGSAIDPVTLFNGIKNGTISVSQQTRGDVYNQSFSYEFRYNGKEYKASLRQSPNSGKTEYSNRELFNFLEKVNKIKYTPAVKKYTENRQAYIDQNFEAIRMTNKVIQFAQKDPRSESLVNDLSSALPEGFDVKSFGVGTTALNQGNAYFFIQPKSGSEFEGYSEQQIADLIKSYTNKEVTFSKVDKGAPLFEIKGLNNRVTNQFRQFSPLESTVLSSLYTHTGSGDYISGPFNTPLGDANFQIKKSNGLFYLYVGGLKKHYQAFQSAEDAIYAARQLSANNNRGVNQLIQFSQGR